MSLSTRTNWFIDEQEFNQFCRDVGFRMEGRSFLENLRQLHDHVRTIQRNSIVNGPLYQYNMRDRLGLPPGYLNKTVLHNAIKQWCINTTNRITDEKEEEKKRRMTTRFNTDISSNRSLIIIREQDKTLFTLVLDLNYRSENYCNKVKYALDNIINGIGTHEDEAIIRRLCSNTVTRSIDYILAEISPSRPLLLDIDICL